VLTSPIPGRPLPHPAETTWPKRAIWVCTLWGNFGLRSLRYVLSCGFGYLGDVEAAQYSAGYDLGCRFGY
jgi:hypothetical protein